MEDKGLRHIPQLAIRRFEEPIWEKACLTIEEAAAYTGIGREKLRMLVNQKKCPFVMPMGKQLFIIRDKLDAFLKGKNQI